MNDTFLHPKGLPFLKMHGLGNDFVVVDARGVANPISAPLASAIGSRHFGVGFDQLALMQDTGDADVELVFFNSDGSLSDACGNATRCVARLMMDDLGKDAITIKTGRGLLPCERAGAGLIRVNMGQPLLDWRDVPLSHAMDTLELPIEGAPAAMSMGNPHCTFIVDDAEAVDLETRGAEIEHHSLYPERTNVEFISLVAPDEIRMRIWERGAGVTWASGSGSSAAAVTAARKGLTGRKVKVHVDGGMIEIDWREDGVWMTGTTALVFSGVLSPEFLRGIDD